MEESVKSVTILCSTYNSEKWIDGYLESINSQLLETFDIIFVDANSTDSSLETIKNYNFREGIHKTVIACDSKVGIYEAWNIAVEKANTPYVINVNTDDRLYPTALIIYLAHAVASPGFDVIYGSYQVVSDSSHLCTTQVKFAPPHDHRHLLQDCYCGPFPFLKRQTIVDSGGFNPKFTISGDYEMWLRLSKKGKTLQAIPEVIGSYYENPEGMSTNRESAHWQEHLQQDHVLRITYA
jgi:GT2 family glycosyltransferase